MSSLCETLITLDVVDMKTYECEKDQCWFRLLLESIWRLMLLHPTIKFVILPVDNGASNLMFEVFTTGKNSKIQALQPLENPPVLNSTTTSASYYTRTEFYVIEDNIQVKFTSIILTLSKRRMFKKT